MKVLVTGANGQLGYDVIRELHKRKIECIGTLRQDFDITDFKSVEKFITEYNPQAVIHCAAYTAVDRAEEELGACYDANVKATENVAKICKKLDIKMVYISTDYVFPGIGEKPYEINDITGPLGIYGKTKLEGENKVKVLLDKYFIVRISWVFGVNGNNFVKTMLKIGKAKSVLNVVADQIGSPTYTIDVAKLLCDMIETDKYGVYHATNEGYCSWAEFAEEIFKVAGYDIKVNHVSTTEYPTRAVRPQNSRLSLKSLDENGFGRLPHWENSLIEYIEELKNGDKKWD